MVRRRICSLLFAVVTTTVFSAYAQQNHQDSNTKTADTQPPKTSQPGNLNLPGPSEKWDSLSDIKTGLNPRPAARYETDEQPEFVRELYRLRWRDTDPIDVWLIRPKIVGKVPQKSPVVLYLYTYTDTDQRFRDNDWCKRATADGFAAVGFTSYLADYRFRSRALSKWFVSELAESLGGTTHDVQLILNFLAETGEVDMNRVGVFGMGSGATIAILAAQADPRISTVDVLEPWGDWPEWLSRSAVLSPEERPKYASKAFLDSVAPLDPVLYLPSLKTPNVHLRFVLNGQITPPVARERIAAAAPTRATITKYQNTEDLYKAWLITGLSGWIKEQLRHQSSRQPDDDLHMTKSN